MAYATIDDMRLAIGEDTLRVIGDRTGDRVVDAATVQAALDEASALADTYLEDYLPLAAPFPVALRRAVIDIAVYYLSLHHAMSASVETSYHAQIRWLEQIAAGKLSLGVPRTAEADIVGSIELGDAETVSRPREWTHLTSRGIF